MERTRDAIVSAPPNDQNPVGTSPVNNAVHRAGGDAVIIGHKTLREKLRIDIMAQLKASVLKAHRCEDGQEIEITAGAVGELNADAVLRAAMAVTAFGPGGDAPGDVNDDVTLTLLSQRPMMLQDSEVEVKDRVGAVIKLNKVDVSWYNFDFSIC